MDMRSRHAIPLTTFISHPRKLLWRNEKHEKLLSLLLPVCHVACHLDRTKSAWELPGSDTLAEAQSSPSLLHVFLRTYPGPDRTWIYPHVVTDIYALLCYALKYCFLLFRGNSVLTQPHSVYGHFASLIHHNNVSLIK